MKPKNSNRLSPSLALTMAALAVSAMALTGCGSSNSTPVVTSPVTPIPGVTTPVAGVPTAGCVPVSQPIPFQANNVYFDSANMVGGIIPGRGQAIGSTIIGGGVMGSGNYHNIAGDASITANITPGGAYPGTLPYSGYVPANNYNYFAGAIPTSQYGYYSYPGSGGTSTANVQGTISIGQLALQDIYMKFSNGGVTNTNYFAFPSTVPYQPYSGYYYPGYQNTPYNTSALGNVCVSQIAFDLGHWDSHGLIYGGRVYLYLNNTQHGYILWI